MDRLTSCPFCISLRSLRLQSHQAVCLDQSAFHPRAPIQTSYSCIWQCQSWDESYCPANIHTSACFLTLRIQGLKLHRLRLSSVFQKLLEESTYWQKRYSKIRGRLISEDSTFLMNFLSLMHYNQVIYETFHTVYSCFSQNSI